MIDSYHAIDPFRRARQALSGTVGFVPTMGYLHEGHLALVARARDENDHVIVSIFVNPTQFDRADDLDRYPRDLQRDLQLLDDAGMTMVLAPSGETIYPQGYATTVTVAGLTERLEGAKRPGHFDGVATVVAKLLNIVQPDRAYFGQKDAQQLVVVRRMVADLNLPVQIIGVPTVREADGLALSSRNVFLQGDARADALALSQALGAAQAAWQQGERDAATLRRIATDRYADFPGVEVEYLSLADPDTLKELHGPIKRGLMSTAAWVGGVRLIDNVAFDPTATQSK
ncbi:MAG: pantoate--beta-alanine ligase [Anaerolineales bacterium]|nr:pantoate--beta-alanine ligase [Anaerolineales bacterium]MCB9128548.1 pantoate--beta-alanine ligase [Ardenticatenales bacterium]